MPRFSRLHPKARQTILIQSRKILPLKPAGAERLAWHRATTVEAYDRVGKKDPKWDAAARKVLEAFANSGASTNLAGKDYLKAADEAAAEALAAGCKDPLVQYIYDRGFYGFAQAPFTAERYRSFVDGGLALAKSEYPTV